jgi:hypothetical protein
MIEGISLPIDLSRYCGLSFKKSDRLGNPSDSWNVGYQVDVVRHGYHQPRIPGMVAEH